MSNQPPTRAPRATLALLLGVLAIVAVACSSATEDTMPDDLQIVTLPPPTAGASCTDPEGDISDSAQQVAGTLTEPTGIDLLDVKADVSDTDLTLSFTTAGPIEQAPAPLFYVSQGPSGLEASFELRAQPASAGGAWTVGLITWEQASGGLRESDPRPLSVPVSVAGDRLSFSVPLTELPKIATLVWQFGAAANLPPAPGSTTRKTVLDDCNNMSDQTGPGTTVVTAEEGPTTTVPSGVLDTPLVSNDGVTVTVFSFQNPPTKLEPLTVPPSEGYEPAVIDAEVCAGDTDTTVRPGNFRLLTSENELWSPWDAPQAATLPAFPAAGTLLAGDCVRGWLTYEVPSEATFTDVVFTPDSGGDGTGTLLWSI